MKDSENIYKQVIDKYYNELPDEIEKNISIEETILSDKLNIVLNKMDILKTDNSTSNINILEIIKNGEMIKQNRKNSLEFIIFISLSLIIIFSLILIAFYFGEKFFVYYELLTFILIPVLIIPLEKLSQTGGN
jgi:hypothetical protein